jgi:ribonuclease-3
MQGQPSEDLEALIGHRFEDKALLKAALTHSSTGALKNYERLEFLGDRVLGLVIAELLYRRFPDEKEGDLARRLAALVQGSFLAGIAQEMALGRYIDFSDAEAHAGGADNENILSDVFESLIGALYLDAGFSTCQTLIEKFWLDRLDLMNKPPQHPKTHLQEWAQAQGLPLPEYKIIGQHGPDHAPIFDIELHVQGYPVLTAQGRSRQAAEKTVAEKFISQNKGMASHE